MIFYSILSPGVSVRTANEPDAANERDGQPGFFVDLNLDQIVAAITVGKDEYDLTGFFHVSLHDVDSIEYRQEIMRDLENAGVIGAICRFAERLHDMRQHRARAEKLRYQRQKERWFLDAVAVYCDAVSGLVADLAGTVLTARGLLAFRDYVTAYAASAPFAALANWTQRLAAGLAAVHYCVRIDGARVQVSKFEGERDYSRDVEATFARFKQGSVKDYAFSFRDSPEMNHIEENILDLVAKIYPDIFGDLKAYCATNSEYVDETAGEWPVLRPIDRGEIPADLRHDQGTDRPVKVHLLYPDRDFDPRQPLPWNEQALAKDLALDTLFKAMAGEDKFVLEVVRRVILSGLDNGIGTILYRQDVLRDCLQNPDVVRELYAVAGQAVEEEKRHYLGSILGNHPGTVLRRSVAMIEAFLGMLRRMGKIAHSGAGNFHSQGWCAFFAVLRHELDDAYFGEVEYHLARLKFRHGMVLSTGLDQGNKARRYVLRQPAARTGGWLARLFAPKAPVFAFSLHPRDENGARALSELRDQGISGPPARSPSPPTMPTAFSAGCGRNWRSMSVAPVCMNCLPKRANPHVSPYPWPPRSVGCLFRGSTMAAWR